MAKPCVRSPKCAVHAAFSSTIRTSSIEARAGLRRSRSVGSTKGASMPAAASLARSMEVLETRLEGPILTKPRVFDDERGFFSETYRQNVFADLGISEAMIQDNHSRS